MLKIKSSHRELEILDIEKLILLVPFVCVSISISVEILDIELEVCGWAWGRYVENNRELEILDVEQLGGIFISVIEETVLSDQYQFQESK